MKAWASGPFLPSPSPAALADETTTEALGQRGLFCMQLEKMGTLHRSQAQSQGRGIQENMGLLLNRSTSLTGRQGTGVDSTPRGHFS